MARDWDRHYSDGGGLDKTPDALLVEAAESSAPGLALDLACGPGRHALYLAALGWRVDAVDRSATAVRILRARAAGLPVTVIEEDLETGAAVIALAAYDLICDFLYLHRALFPQIREGVRPGGMFVAAIAMVDPEATEGPYNPDFLLQAGELRREFADWKVLFYSEARRPGDLRRTARIIARRA